MALNRSQHREGQELPTSPGCGWSRGAVRTGSCAGRAPTIALPGRLRHALSAVAGEHSGHGVTAGWSVDRLAGRDCGSWAVAAGRDGDAADAYVELAATPADVVAVAVWQGWNPFS